MKVSATITADYGGQSDTASVSVTAALQSISVTLGSNNLQTGDTTQATVMASYTNGSSVDVTGSATYSSSDTNVATVDASGQVTAAGEGQCDDHG
ncbi:MAG: Ig-like domain-containing protein [Natrialbaceae archaeon]|nr:Ig-like domain-containing protein [Natrialbaceae archaeon]